jgi:hypothetical protein
MEVKMTEIIYLVESCFSAKRKHGPESGQFKAAQKLAFQKINQTYKAGDVVYINVPESGVLPSPIKIKIEKKGEGADFCSFVLAKTQD